MYDVAIDSMRLINDPAELTEVFEDLISRYDKFHCCVAWAGAPKSFRAGKLLLKHASKIKKIVVGLHFYQTHPDFISTFIEDDRVRFIMETHGVFHDKIYLFSNTAKDWCAIIGSSNFTKGGFENNSECNIIISDADEKGINTYKALIRKIENTYKSAIHFTDTMFGDYQDCYNHQKGKRDSLGSVIKTSKRDFDSSELTLMPWDEYCALLRKTNRVQTCIDVLSNIQILFNENKSYGDMNETERKSVAGFVSHNDIYAFFGTTKRNYRFGKLIEANDKNLAKIIDSIPSEGDMTFAEYKKFINYFLDKWDAPLATATRLLAMKRPDAFLCVNGKNKRMLAKYLNIPSTTLSLQNYWDLVVVPIRQASWYNNRSPKQGNAYWPYRVALLDALIYEP